ncbi:MAG: hypothetical protein NC212_06370 [Staphylococcus sp.]|nr:hypothetical protein [Staphylococcus sp.]
MKKISLLFILLGVFIASCSSDEPQNNTNDVKFNVTPSIQIYKLNGDYAHLVTVMLDENRQHVVALPGIKGSLNKRPVELSNGFYLNGWGIVGYMTGFTNWTYDEYLALPDIPTVDEIERNIVRDARVVEIYKMPIDVNQSETEIINQCNKLIEAGLPGCELRYKE